MCQVKSIDYSYWDYYFHWVIWTEMCYSQGVFQSEKPKEHMVTIGVYQLLIASALYEHRCLENTNKLYKYAGKCDYQQQYKAIIEAAMVYNPKGLTENSPLDVV